MTKYQIVQYTDEHYRGRNVVDVWDQFHVAVQSMAVYQGDWPDAHLCVEGVDDEQAELDEIRKSVGKEDVSYGELARLRVLADLVRDDDVELLSWLGESERV